MCDVVHVSCGTIYQIKSTFIQLVKNFMALIDGKFYQTLFSTFMTLNFNQMLLFCIEITASFFTLPADVKLYISLTLLSNQTCNSDCSFHHGVASSGCIADFTHSANNLFMILPLTP